MATVEHPVSARTIERKFAQMEGTRSRPIGPAPTPEAATKHQQDNTKRIKMLRDAYSAKHERLMKQTAHLANVKRQLDEVDNITASEIEVLQKKIGDAGRDENEAEKETQRIEELLQKAKEDLEKKKHKKHLLTEHLCLIISETEKEKSAKLANLYRQLEFEEQEVKEARKDLVAAIALEARRSSETSSVLESMVSRNPPIQKKDAEVVHPQQQNGLPQQQTMNGDDKREGEAEKDPNSSPKEGIFSGFSWGVEAVSDHVNSLISTPVPTEEDSPSPSPQKPELRKDEEEKDISMDQLFEGFSPEELSE
eukprot:CAMPEP_0201490130 /NCGR_PEP_ID=MMETSP0151_2-20130828/25155_1 /ASSEMBLY_ACC=CAM_ASM_000257 /TAXON_ID=200890 /ORGANISM="Paramoeba atlantica, Strain 621/1 / CCAP 1560/9" /LENGTH=308 /DNA_ID=CAMNT_0047875959 /DNA_START=13 /DNA_END=936 /DNA_ORIENTATION=-